MVENKEECPYCSGANVAGCYCIDLKIAPNSNMSVAMRSALEVSVARFNALSIEERADHRRQQRESFIRGEMGWPIPKYEMKMIDGVLTKVYASQEDYYNG